MKWFLKSKTIWGVIISIIPTLLPAFGVSFSADDVALVSSFGDTVMQTVGAILAIYGRVKAKDTLTIS